MRESEVIFITTKHLARRTALRVEGGRGYGGAFSDQERLEHGEQPGGKVGPAPHKGRSGVRRVCAL